MRRAAIAAIVIAMFIPALFAQTSCPPAPVLVQTAGSNPTCPGYGVELDAGPGYVSYQWSNGQRSQRMWDTPFSTMNHTVTVTDANGCTMTSAPYQIVVKDAPASHTIHVTPSYIFAGDTVTASIDGPVSNPLHWDIYGATPTTPVDGTSVSFIAPSGYGGIGIYLTETGPSGCSGNSMTSVQVSTSQPLTINTNATSLCPMQSASASISGTWDTTQWSIVNGTFQTNSYPYYSTTASGPSVAFNPSGSGDIVLTVNTYSNSPSGPTGHGSKTIPLGTGTPVTLAVSQPSICPRGTYDSASVTNASDFSFFEWTIVNGMFSGSPMGSSSVYFNATSDQPVTITVDATDYNGCHSTATQTVQIRTLAPPTINVSQPSLCPNGTYVQAAVANPSDYSNIEWSVAGGMTSGGPPFGPSIYFNATSSDPVTVTAYVTDYYGCRASASVTVPIRTLAPPEIVVSEPSLCQNGTYAQASVTNSTNYANVEWTVTNGMTSGGPFGPSIYFNATGSAPVTLTAYVTDFTGCRASASVTVPIRTLTAPQIRVSEPSLCANGTYAEASVANPYDYATFEWSVTNGNISSPYPGYPGNSSSITFNANSSDPVTVTLTVTDFHGCRATSSVTVPIRTVPAPQIVVSEPSLCTNGTYAEASVPNPYDYATFEWTVTNGNVSSPFGGGNNNATVSFNANSGQPVTVTLTVTDFHGCRATSSVTVPIRTIQPPQIVVSEPSLCTNGTYAEASVPNSTDYASFSWTVTNGTISSPFGGGNNNSTVSFNANSTEPVTVSLTVTDFRGCTATTSTMVPIRTIQPPQIVVSEPSLCTNGTYAEASVPNPTDYASFSWTVTNGTVSTPFGGGNNNSTVSFNANSTNPVTVSLTVTDFHGCRATSSVTVPIRTISAPQIQLSTQQVCEGGYVEATVANPTDYASFNWTVTNANVATTYSGNGSILSFNSNSSQPMVVTLTVTDFRGCRATTSTTVPVIAAPNATITVGQVYNSRTNSMSESMAVEGASTHDYCGPQSLALAAPYAAGNTYLWSTGETTPSIHPFVNASTTYSVTVTNASGCSAAGSTTINIQTRPTVSITSSSPTICPNDTVTLTASDAGSWLWSTGETTRSIVITSPGYYSVQATTGACTVGASTTIAPFTADITTSIQRACAGSTATLTASAGASYHWSTGQTTQSITTTTDGTWTVTITDATGCAVTSATATVTGLAPLAASLTPSGSLNACASALPTLHATATGGDGNYTYSWEQTGTVIPGATTANYVPTASGYYAVTVRDGAGCSIRTAATWVSFANSPSAQISTYSSVCAGQQSYARVNGNPPTASYVWSVTNGTIVSQNGDLLTYIPGASGNAGITVIATIGSCSTTSSVNVPINPAPDATITASGPTTFCAGGSVTLTAAAGAANYYWSNGEQTQSITVTTAGDYSVTTQGANGCPAQSQHVIVTVTPLPNATITASGSTAICPGSSVTLTAPSGVTASWYRDGAFVATQASIDATVAGTYELRTSANGCTNSSSVVVTMNAKPTAVVSGSSAICAGSSATISATLTGVTPFSITWSDGLTQSGINTTSVTRNVSSSGTWTITNVSDANCSGTSTGSAVITVNAKPTAVVSGTTAICAGSSATISATLSGAAPFSITWSDGVTQSGINATSATRSVSSSGTWTITSVSDANCSGTSTGSAVITVNAKPTAVVSGTTAICAGSSATISATLTGAAPFSITWSDGVTQSGINTTSVTRSVSSSGTWTITSVSDANCSGTSTGSAVITVNAKPTAVVSGTTAICAGSSATISATLTGVAPFSITWSDGVTQSGINTTSVTRSVSSPGTWTITSVSDANCSGTSTGSAVITVNAKPTAVVSGTTAICAGSSATISATLTGAAPFSITWSDGVTQSGINATSVTRSVSSSGTYTITSVSDANCSGTSTGSAVITVNAKPTAVVSGTTAICAGSSATISATLTGVTPFSITWSDGLTQSGINTTSVTRNVSSSGTWTITNVSDANCSGTSTGSAVITVNTKPTAVVSGTTAICAGSSATIGATLTGAAPFSITWSDGVTQSGINASSVTRSVSPSNNTTYTITSVSDANCSGTATGSATITINAKPTAVVSGTSAICAGSSATISATLTGVAPFSITWSDGVTQSGINASSVTRSVSPSNNTTYTITTVSDANCGGTSTGSAAITVRAKPTAVVSGSSSGCPSTSRTITATLTGAAPFAITWSDGLVQSGISTTTATRSVSPASTTTYTVTAVNDANCSGGTASGSAVVTVTAAPSITQQPANLTTTRNTTVTLHVVAGPAGVTYLWQTLNGSTWTTATGTGATTADFSTSQSRKGTFQYRVIVSDACSPVRSVTSNTVTLTVN